MSDTPDEEITQPPEGEPAEPEPKLEPEAELEPEPESETEDAPPPPRDREQRGLGAPLGPVPRVGARAFLGLDRLDVVWLLVLVGVAFAIRVASPISLNLLSNPTSGSPVTAGGLGVPYNGPGCTNAPADANGNLLPVTTQSPDAGGRLITINTPDVKHCGFVFDEVYFPVDAAYDARDPTKDYFDPEPPLTKLLMAPAIKLLGFGTWSWRITSAISGSLLVGVVYLMARRLRRERFFAIAAGIIISLDGLELVESRTGVIDITAIFIAALAFYLFLLHWGARTRTQWLATLYIFAAVLGLAFGAKLTAIAPAVVAIALVLARLFEPWLLGFLGRSGTRRGAAAGEAAMWRDAAHGPRALIHYIAAGVLAVVVFTACYSRYLTVDHTLDNFAACTPANGLTLDTSAPTNGSPFPGTTLYRAPHFQQDGSLVQRLMWFPADVIRDVKGQVTVSLKYHSTECRGHPYASRWYTWPVLAHPVLFYVGSPLSPTGQSDSAYITNLGNPAIWWLAIPALLFCCIAMTTGKNWVVRLAPLALLSVSLALMTLSFHDAEKKASVAVEVHPSVLFTIGLTGMLLTGAIALYGAVLLRRTAPALILLGFLAAWLMWVPGNEQRVLFLYHMLGALPFMALALAYALSALRVTVLRAGSLEIPLRPFAYAGLGVVVATFVFFYPIWTGAAQPTADHDLRMWFESWVQGWN